MAAFRSPGSVPRSQAPIEWYSHGYEFGSPAYTPPGAGMPAASWRIQPWCQSMSSCEGHRRGVAARKPG